MVFNCTVAMGNKWNSMFIVNLKWLYYTYFHSVSSYVQYKIAFNIDKKHFEGKFYSGNMFTLVRKI